MDYGRRVRVVDTDINVYSEGKGELTVVFMAGSGVGCPVLEYKPLYSRMSDEYRIVVAEKAGYGLSGPAHSPRTVENLVSEVREALKAAGIMPPYVLAPHSYSGFEAIWWACNYPEEVEAVLGIDMGLPNMMAAQAKEIPHDKKRKMVDSHRKLMQKLSKRGLLDKLLRNRTVNASGLLDSNELTDDEKLTYEEVYYRNIASEAVFEESLLAEENAQKADRCGVLRCRSCLFISNMKSPVKALSWQQAARDYGEKCGAELHFVNEGHMMYTRIPDEMASVFKAFLKNLTQSKG